MKNEAANSEATVEITLASTPQKRYCAVLDSSLSSETCGKCGQLPM